MGGGKSFPQSLCETGITTLVRLDQNICLQQTRRLIGVQQLTLSPFDVADHNRVLPAANIKITMGYNTTNFNPVRNAIQRCQLRAVCLRLWVGVSGSDTGLRHLRGQANSIIPFGATHIDNQRITTRNNLVNHRS